MLLVQVYKLNVLELHLWFVTFTVEPPGFVLSPGLNVLVK